MLLSVAPRTLRGWPGVPRNADGTYQWKKLLAYYIERMSGSQEFADQRQRLAAAQAERVETENAIRRGELVVVSEAQTGWISHIGAARAKLLSMGKKLGPRLVNVSDPNVINEGIHVEVCAALEELAGWEPPAPQADNAEHLQVSSEGVAAAAESNRKSVGRRKKKAQ